MSKLIQKLDPKLVWKHFDAIRQIPRSSGSEQAVAAHIEAWAVGQGWQVRRDAAGNRLVAVPARPGHESAPIVILQAHLDMVCEKNAAVEHDFGNDPIDARIDGELVKARGTTLGADNGIGVAMALAAAEDPDIQCGALELLLTVEEEVGLRGAAALDADMLHGRLLVNLDSEDDDTVFIGCAGARGVELKLPLTRARYAGAPYVLKVSGLRGGHSGIDIQRGRGNAIRLLARLLASACGDAIDVGIVDFEGGDKGNALAREASASLILDAGAASALAAVIERWRPIFAERLATADPDLLIALDRQDETVKASTNALPSTNALAPTSRHRLLALIEAVPHGVLAMQADIPDQVETSCNLARLRTEPDMAKLLLGFRSSLDAALELAVGRLRSVAWLASAEMVDLGGYPGWQPAPSSPLLAIVVDAYRQLFDDDMKVATIHAGLECGLLVRKLSSSPGEAVQAVSIGPQIRNPHSPDESVSIPSVERIWRLLKKVLQTAAEA